MYRFRAEELDDAILGDPRCLYFGYKWDEIPADLFKMLADLVIDHSIKVQTEILTDSRFEKD